MAAARGASYAPWLVANLTLAEAPIERGGAQLAWDNVLYDSPALGYVVATHQQIRVRPGPTVLTYYRALSGEPPPGRGNGCWRPPAKPGQSRSWPIWKGLTRHPRPDDAPRRFPQRPRHGAAGAGYDLGRGPPAPRRRSARLHFAHADVSGLSLFEEANYRGVLAAQRVLQRLGAGPGRSLV